MSDANPFSDPFADQSVTNATATSQQSNLEDYNPFANQGEAKSQPAVMEPTGSPPAYSPTPAATKDSQPTPQQQAVQGQEELLRRQEELERKAEELAQRERQLNAGAVNARANNWPPFPTWCPFGPCFYQDFGLDIPLQSQRIIKLLYYSWMFYVMILFLNIFASLAIFIVDTEYGVGFGLAILWFCLFSPCSLCWYRPAYNAFKSDSSFWFFFYFFIMFCQVITSFIMAIGITNSGYAGLITALSIIQKQNIGVAVIAFVMAFLFGVNTILEIVLLKKVHSIYRTSGASFEKAQQEFASGVMKNPGVQSAATQAATSALNRN